MESPRTSCSLFARWLAIAAIALCLSAQPAFATAFATADTPADEDTRTAREAPQTETVLATEAAARVGIVPAKADAKVPAAPMQITDDPTMKWLLIIGISVIAIWLIVTLAD